jgi:ferric-dicitrate binding protein FerR (iron transport regulator)
VADVFKHAEPPVPDLGPKHPERDDEIALIEQAMDRKRRRASRFRLFARWSTAAAVVFVCAATWRLATEKPGTSRAAARTGGTSAEPTVVAPVAIAIAIASGGGAIVGAPGASMPAGAGRTLQAGSRLMVDPGAGATLSLSTGTHLDVEPGSQLTVVEDGRAQIFALSAGSLRADVAKLAHGERFIVRTGDAEIEVHGTSFLVDVVPSDPACGDGATTRVTVYEGVVAVRSRGTEDSLRAGERWPRGCRKSAAVLVPTSPPVPKREPKNEAVRVVSARPAAVAPLPLVDGPSLPIAPPSQGATAPRPPSSGLVEENDLFAEGMLARRYGNLPLALAKMDRFLEKFPSSHLAENAVAERMRLLRTLDPPKAIGAANYYLQRYSNGFARAEAEGILTGTR